MASPYSLLIRVGTLLILLTPVLGASVQNNSSIPSTLRCTPQPPGDDILCCVPAKVTDFITFYVGNYIAHVVTLNFSPGQQPTEKLALMLAALFYPLTGAVSGLLAVFSMAVFADTELRTAARAGALCCVVEKSKISKASLNEQYSIHGRKLHGQCQLPPGYILLTLPWNAKFENDDIPPGPKPGFVKKIVRHVKELIFPPPQESTMLSCNYSFMKILISLVQFFFAISTLYRSKGDQVDRYGYAAFGLTVVPYLSITLLNLLGSLICPQYDSMFLVESETLRKLINSRELELTNKEPAHEEPAHEEPTHEEPARGDLVADESAPAIVPRLLVSGITATLDESEASAEDQVTRTSYYGDMRAFISLTAAMLFFLITSLAIIGGVSHFKTGGSTLSQRAWAMCWFSFGIVFGLLIFLMRTGAMRAADEGDIHQDAKMLIVTTLLFSPPAIGGLVVVGQMIKSYGICTLF